MGAPPDCLFCRIVRGEIPAKIVHQDDHVVAFEDIHKQAKVHVLVIPRRHVASVDALGEGDADLVGRLVLAARAIAAAQGLSGGYRLVVNQGEDAGQTVLHLHLHLLGGRSLGWPPG